MSLSGMAPSWGHARRAVACQDDESEVCTTARYLVIEDRYPFVGDHPYAFAQAPPISIARSASLSRSVKRNGSTACS